MNLLRLLLFIHDSAGTGKVSRRRIHLQISTDSKSIFYFITKCSMNVEKGLVVGNKAVQNSFESQDITIVIPIRS